MARQRRKDPKTSADLNTLIAKAMPEKELMANVKALALARGWLYYHTYRSDRSDKGFFDVVLARFRPSWDRGGFKWEALFVELKREGKKPTVEQQKWVDTFAVCNLYTPPETEGHHPIVIRSFVWRPSDWLNGTIEKALE